MDAWMKEIDRATSEAEVVAHARDFCSLVHPRDLEPLPHELREIRIEAGADIARLQQQFAACGAQNRLREMEKLADLLAYISKAAQKLGELSPPH